jgi:peptidoglycan/xylan/chitin deacetylase (PgdA/CDA1 family)
LNDSDRDLSLGAPLLYPAKAALTRTRSAWWLLTGGRGDHRGLRILFYHRVAHDRDELAVSPRDFERQMERLARDGRRALDVRSAIDALEQPDVIGLSFDDGYLDVAEHAEPVLARLGFSATVFVSSGVTDGRATFTWYARQPPLIDWDEMRRLDGAGVLRFESHTVTHPNLLALDDETARREIVDGKRELEERLGRESRVFCYPAGLYGARERRLVADAGFLLAASCEPGVNTRATDPLALRRIQIDRRDSLLDFRAKVAGGHDSPLRLRAVYRRLRYGVGNPLDASSTR